MLDCLMPISSSWISMLICSVILLLFLLKSSFCSSPWLGVCHVTWFGPWASRKFDPDAMFYALGLVLLQASCCITKSVLCFGEDMWRRGAGEWRTFWRMTWVSSWEPSLSGRHSSDVKLPAEHRLWETPEDAVWNKTITSCAHPKHSYEK